MSDTSSPPCEIRTPAAPRFCDTIDNAIRRLGTWISWTNALLVGVILLQVVLRYGFGRGLVVLEELQWHLYAVGIMFGLSYSMAADSHIRLDILHMRFSRRTKAIVEIIGILVFLLPFIYLVIDQSLPFVRESWRLGERSDAPSGLPFRWAIKAVIPMSFAMLSLTTLSRLIRSFAALRRKV
jgi:TRAP-type mannitol/chloroaromatic compound transport system permease small subunit